MSFGDTTIATDNDMTPVRSATINSTPKFRITDDKKVLTLSDYILDRISLVGGVLDTDYYESQPGNNVIETAMLMKNDSLNVLTIWEEICRVDNGIENLNKKSPNDKTAKHAPEEYRSLTPYFTGESGWEVFWKTLHGGIYSSASASNTTSTSTPEDQARTRFEKWYKTYQVIRGYTDHVVGIGGIVKNPQTSTPQKIMSGLGWGSKWVYKSAKMPFSLLKNDRKGESVGQSNILAWHRAMIRTEEHSYVGLAPRDVQFGDCIALLEGSKMPIVLREINSPAEAERKRFVIVGEAYIHGIMHGEAFEPERCEMMDIS